LQEPSQNYLSVHYVHVLLHTPPASPATLPSHPRRHVVCLGCSEGTQRTRQIHDPPVKDSRAHQHHRLRECLAVQVGRKTRADCCLDFHSFLILRTVKQSTPTKGGVEQEAKGQIYKSPSDDHQRTYTHTRARAGSPHGNPFEGRCWLLSVPSQGRREAHPESFTLTATLSIGQQGFSLSHFEMHL
ncbi:unnamed protein product, partial [Ectocarpus sp. 8 AP-2014]